MTLSLSLASFFSPKLLFHILFSLESRTHPAQEEFDEQKAVVVVKHH